MSPRSFLPPQAGSPRVSAGRSKARSVNATMRLPSPKRTATSGAPSPWDERQLQANVVELATYAGWATYHTFDSRRSNPGWPDLILARPPELLAVELKSARGPVSPEQERWLETLSACGLETHVWRPKDWDEIVTRLGRKR